MPRGITKRLLKAIRRRITSPIRGFLSHKHAPVEEAVVESIHEQTPPQPPRDTPEISSGSHEVTATIKACINTIPTSTAASTSGDTALNDDDGDRRPYESASTTVKQDRSRDKEPTKQIRAQIPQHSHQHDSNAVLAKHQDLIPPVAASFNNPHTAPPSADVAPLVKEKTLSEEYEVIDDDLTGPGPSIRDPSSPIAQTQSIQDNEQEPHVAKRYNIVGNDGRWDPVDVGVVNRYSEPMPQQSLLQQNIPSSSQVTIAQQEQDPLRSPAVEVVERNDSSWSAIARVTEQAHNHSPTHTYPRIRPSDIQQIPKYRPKGSQTNAPTSSMSVRDPAAAHLRPAADKYKAVLRPQALSRANPPPGLTWAPIRPGPCKLRSAATRSPRTSTAQVAEQTRASDILAAQTRQDQASTAKTATGNDHFRGKPPQAPRKHLRCAASPKTIVGQSKTCKALIQKAKEYHARVRQVMAAAESHARAFRQEVAASKRPFVVMQCTFVRGILMVGLCEIISLGKSEAGEASRSADSYLIPIEPNLPNPKATPTQVHFGDDGQHFGKHSWIDISIVYQVPADLVEEGLHACLQLCKCSWEKTREELSMGTVTEEKFGIEREFKRHQIKWKDDVIVPDYAIRATDRIPRLEAQQPQTPPRQRLQPYLPRSQVHELLQHQQLR